MGTAKQEGCCQSEFPGKLLYACSLPWGASTFKEKGAESKTGRRPGGKDKREPEWETEISATGKSVYDSNRDRHVQAEWVKREKRKRKDKSKPIENYHQFLALPAWRLQSRRWKEACPRDLPISSHTSPFLPVSVLTTVKKRLYLSWLYDNSEGIKFTFCAPSTEGSRTYWCREKGWFLKQTENKQKV